MASLLEIRQLFFVECEEQLEQLNDGLSEISEIPDGQDPDSEIINTMFRAVHSIKGGAASFSLDAIVRFSHVFETVLDEVRAGKLHLSPNVVQVFFRGADYLSDLIALGAVEENPDESDLKSHIEELNGVSEKAVAENLVDLPKSDDVLGSFQPVELAFNFETNDDEIRLFSITFVPSKQLFDNGHEPVHLFRELAALGDLSVKASWESGLNWHGQLPTISWILQLSTTSSEADVCEVFEFAQDFSDFKIDTVSVFEGADLVGSELDSNEISMIDENNVNPVYPSPSSEKQATSFPSEKKVAKPISKATVRVDLELVDELINMVGELVITQSVMTQSIGDAGLSTARRMTTTLEEFKTLTRRIQEGVMAIRAQSVKPLFQRMGRIVRETAQIAGKDVRFISEGEDTEVDRTVIERLVDPLTHIIRNAIDHGLEDAEKRSGLGKDPSGSVTLSAAHRSGRVVIEVKDDGGGVDRERVLASAISKGIVQPSASLSPSEIDWLLFTPGFSTASEVTNLSGRGVGMDVVNNEIRRLGGRVSIVSIEGKGTTISISLPLTLAVLDGMIVDVAGQTMVVPISAIVETIRPEPSQLHWIGSSAQMITVRDVLIPIVELGGIFADSSKSSLEREGVLLLVEDEQGEQCALAVDRIYDQRQVVIKSLESNYGNVPFVAAATILGDGQIALIVDLDEITQKRAQAASDSLKSIGVSA